MADGRTVALDMARAIAHRGPDGEGVESLTGQRSGLQGWFGHRRLRVLDLSDAAKQPMPTDDGNGWLVFNGEIYNFVELRSELRASRHRFSSTGDTEVIVRAYAEWGVEFVRRLDGMFALALWDGTRERLTLARDRIGKKPLFYTVTDGVLTFASEIKSLGRAPWIRLTPRRDALPELLMLGYVPWPETPYDGVLQVPPGSTVCFDARSGGVRVSEYWSGLPELPLESPAAETSVELADLLQEATRRRLAADVPLGCLLSGGIDSSVVAAMAAKETEEPLHTFSIGFPEETSFDERRWARLVADHLGTTHTEYAVRPDAVALVDRLVWLHDGPFADSSAVPTYLVCELASQEVTVALTGDGGDEIFGGDERFTAAALPGGAPRLVLRAPRARPRPLPP